MTFFARPDLSDIQFRQLSDSVLTLSGSTRISSISGLSLIGDGGFIPVVATGETNGYVMTYDSTDNKIKLSPSSISGSTAFPQGCSTITRFSQNPQYNVNVCSNTVETFLENFFFPSVGPFSSLSVINSYSGGSDSATVRQFGDISMGCLCWNVTCNTYPICTISASTNGSGSYNSLIYQGTGVGTTGDTVTYTYTPACATPSSGCTYMSIPFNLYAKTCNNEVSTSVDSIEWKNKRYDFKNCNLYDATDDASIAAIANALPNVSPNGSTAIFTTGKSMTCTITFDNQFFYYMYPKILGTPTFTINGFPNNAWGNHNLGTLFTIDFVNSNSYSNRYYVARSDSRVTGTFTIVIT